MDRKFTLSLACAAMLAASLQAAPVNGADNGVSRNDAMRAVLECSSRNHSLKTNRAPMRAGEYTTVITDPEGREQECTTTGDGYYMFMNYQFSYYGDVVATKLVYGDNGEIYFYNILPYGATNTYVKGQIEGDKVVLELPQTVAWDNKEKYGINLDILEYYEEGNRWSYRPAADRHSVTFTIGEDESLTLEDLGEGYQLGYVYSDNDEYLGYGATALYIQHFNDKLVEVPETADIQNWCIVDYDWGTVVKVAFDGDDVYIGGLFYEYFPDVWIKGSIVKEDDKTTIHVPGYQYLGMDTNVFTYLAFAVEGETDEGGYTEMELLGEDYEYVFDYDPETRIISGDHPDVEIVANGGKEYYYSMESIYDPVIRYQESYEGTPADPYGLTYLPTDFHQYGFIFYVPSVSTEDTVLDSSDMCYVVYVDGLPFEFTAEEFDLDSDITEVPYAFGNDFIQNYGGTCRWIWFDNDNMSELGVQSIYRYNGVETRSNIVSIQIGSNTLEPVIGKEVMAETYFDLAGRKVVSPANGVYVCKRIFTDGTTVTEKVIVCK